MNTSKAQTIINQLIADQQKRQVTRKQYPVAKHQITKLTELGIIDLMPAKFGYTDAAVVIEAATNGKTAVMNAYGEGEEIGASDLYLALHEEENPAVMDKTTDSIVGEQIVADFDAMLEDVAAYEDTRDNPDEADFMADHLESMSESKAEFQKKFSAYKAQLERGKAYYADGYRARVTERHVEGDGHDVPATALAQRKVWSGYLATSPTFRWQYLVKIGG